MGGHGEHTVDREGDAGCDTKCTHAHTHTQKKFTDESVWLVCLVIPTGCVCGRLWVSESRQNEEVCLLLSDFTILSLI